MQVRVRALGAASLLGFVTAVWAMDASAEAVRFYELEGFGHFLDGNPQSTAVTEEGAIALPPPSRDWFSDPAAVFSAAAALGDEVLVARVEDGQVQAIDRAGKARNVFKSEDTLVTAIATQGDDVFVATGSPAKLYRVNKDGKSELYFSFEADYVWGLAEGPSGSLLAVTGAPGTVVRIDKKSSGTVLFAPEQEHLRSVLYDKTLGIFVGGGARGIVYRAQNGKDFRALFDTGQNEVTSLVTHGPYVFAAGVSGAQELVASHQKGDKGGKGPNVRSQLVRVSMDGSSEVLAGSSDEGIFALAMDDKGQVLVATGATGREDPRGRVYSIDPQKRLISMVLQSPSKRITHLVPLGRGALAAVGAAGGRITSITSGYAPKGEFFTLPYDVGINSRFGVLQVFGTWPKGTSVTAAVRTGQTAEPDGSWSEWSQEINAPGNARPQVPNGRYAQVRITLQGDGKSTPTVYRLRLAYLRQNLPPFVREVTALKKGLALYPLPADSQKSKTISLSEKGSSSDDRRDDDERSSGPGRARQIEEPGALTLRWVADDPNGDTLKYDLLYRPAGDRDWRPLRGGLEAPFYTLNSSQLPDGHYQFRVQASDAPSNAEGEEREDSRESRDVLVDNTPPKIDPLKVEQKDKKMTVRGVFADAVGPLIMATYSLDARAPKPILPDDGVLDGPGESFTLRFGDLAPGKHIVTVRVRDEADNEAVAEASFTVP